MVHHKLGQEKTSDHRATDFAPKMKSYEDNWRFAMIYYYFEINSKRFYQSTQETQLSCPIRNYMFLSVGMIL